MRRAMKNTHYTATSYVELH